MARLSFSIHLVMPTPLNTGWCGLIALSQTCQSSLSPMHKFSPCVIRQLWHEQQTTLSEFLSRNQEGNLGEAETRQLDELMQVYRAGLVRKARALPLLSVGG